MKPIPDRPQTRPAINTLNIQPMNTPRNIAFVEPMPKPPEIVPPPMVRK